MTCHDDSVTKKRLNYSAPVLAMDFDNDGEPIWPCTDCLPWHVEVIESADEQGTIIREWHAVDCPRLIDADLDQDHLLT